MAKFIDFLAENSLIFSYEDVNIIGHSLGAHASGVAGKRTAKKVAIIYGLDPAGPLFYYDEPQFRLDVNDAVTTLALHTNGNSLGFWKPITKIDLYPNGGGTQPGCGSDRLDTCSHSRAYPLYGEAVITENFVAKKCSDFVECAGDGFTFVGEATEIRADGIFGFKTNDASPYGIK